MGCSEAACLPSAEAETLYGGSNLTMHQQTDLTNNLGFHLLPCFRWIHVLEVLESSKIQKLWFFITKSLKWFKWGCWSKSKLALNFGVNSEREGSSHSQYDATQCFLEWGSRLVNYQLNSREHETYIYLQYIYENKCCFHAVASWCPAGRVAPLARWWAVLLLLQGLKCFHRTQWNCWKVRWK